MNSPMLQSELTQFRSTLPVPVLDIYERVKLRFSRVSWSQLSEEQLWYELCLCILSSNVPFELAKSCLAHLIQQGMLEPRWILSGKHSTDMIAHELARPIYLPKKKDGSDRKYRFPFVRARNIAGAASELYSSSFSIRLLLESCNSHFELRNNLAERVPGLGLKEASHFLRNIGYSSELAIIDVHIISFLKELELVSPDFRISVTPKVYFQLENLLQTLAKHNLLDLAVLDNAIWHYMRNKAN